MTELTAQQRSDPVIAYSAIESCCTGTSNAAKQSYLEFLAAAIEYLSLRHPDRWGITLFSWGVRLNVGRVECLVLHLGGLRVLIEKSSAPAGATFDELSYSNAPECEMTTVELQELPNGLTPLMTSHHAALSIAAKRALLRQFAMPTPPASQNC
jgi:hypothetical protein